MLRRLLLCFVFVLCSAPLMAHAGSPIVVVREVEVFNAPELATMAPGLRNMLASRLDGEGYRVVTSGEPGPDGWTVIATITHLGTIYSVDASLASVEGTLPGERSYQTVNDAEALPGALERIARALRDHLADVLSAGMPGVSVVPMPPVPVTPAPEAPKALPSVAAMETLYTQLAEVLKRPRKGPESSGEARSITVVDVDGDGHDEILVLLDEEILAFRDDGVNLRQQWSAPTPSTLQVATISAGDVDGDGTPEVFVAGMNGTHPQSQGYLWFGSSFSPRGRRIPAFVRAVADRSGKTVLVGRTGGLDRGLFGTYVHTYRWNGSQYEKAERFPLPENVSGLNFDLVRLARGIPPYVVHTTGKDRLQLVDPSGEIVYTGDEAVKGSRTLLVGEEKIPGYDDADIVRAQGKAVGWTSPAGHPFLFLPRNSGEAARLFARVSSFGQGRITAYRFDGLTLIPEVEGPGLPGFIPDLCLSTPPPEKGRPVLYTVLVRNTGGLIARPKTLVVAYDLP